MDYQEFLNEFCLEDGKEYVNFVESEIGYVVHSARKWYDFHCSDEDDFDASEANFLEVEFVCEEEKIDDFLEEMRFFKETPTGDLYKIIKT